MLRQVVLMIQDWTGLDREQLQATSAIVAIVGGLALWLGRLWGWRASRREQSQFKKRLDDDHIVIERLVFEETDGGIIFDRETEGGIHALKDVFGSNGLVVKIRAAIRRSENGARIFPSGALHRLMMERVEAYITGNDRSASQSAMFGRKSEYHLDQTAFTVLYMIGEDGFAMLHVLLVNQEYLKLIHEQPKLNWLKARRQSYQKKYFALLPKLAQEFENSAKLFQAIENEDKAGEGAFFWTALIRTRKLTLR
jgi:hypothetical protein